MAITLTGGTGLFDQWGALISTLNTHNTHRLTTLAGRVTTIESKVAKSLTDGIRTSLANWQSQGGSVGTDMSGLAKKIVIALAEADQPQPDATLSTALKYLIAQMKAGANGVERPVVSVSSAVSGTSTGDAVIAASTTMADGVQSDMCYAETMSVTCTADAQLTGATGRETWQARGAAAQSDLLHYNWPDGSGATLSLTAANPSISGASLLTNGTFDDVPSANTFTGWTADVGSAGTTILAGGSGLAYGGAGNVLEFAGNGAELTAVRQDFAAGALLPSRVYAFCVRLKVESVPAAGVLAFQLTDGSGTVVNDAAGTANSVTKDLTTATTSYVAFTGFFRTPAVLPSTLRMRVKLTTALSNTISVYIDHLTMTAASQPYNYGPWLAAFTGATKSLAGDKWNVTVANNYAGAFVLGLWRLLDLPSLSLSIPSETAGTEDIADSLVA